MKAYVCFVFLLCLVVQGRIHVTDLTHSIDASMVFWPGIPKFNFSVLIRRYYQKGLWLENNWFSLSEHGGTHIDAPAHMMKGKWRVHNIPMDHLIGPGVVINVTAKVTKNPDYQLSVQDLKDWELSYGVIPPGAIVIIKSGWSLRYSDPKLMFGSDDVTDWKTFHFPGFGEDAARWLVEKRRIHGVGVESPSIDPGVCKNFIAHQIFFRANIFAVEYMANVHRLPPRDSTVYVAVLKLHDGSGGAARVFATHDDSPNSANPLTHPPPTAAFLSFLLATIPLIY